MSLIPRQDYLDTPNTLAHGLRGAASEIEPLSEELAEFYIELSELLETKQHAALPTALDALTNLEELMTDNQLGYYYKRMMISTQRLIRACMEYEAHEKDY